ncbi:LOW QUALITY PROTEIN: hypothetical protein Cgig2_008264 [Carnegiea gigantea]|uniref:Aminotransferase-like plant mobile domain-containing protein n=1 Tax=Carnegiea gigantea TaxID=171969 RepID=A0A9Q1L0H4_9CARY|nr:LOW QUALITY PROTEIN: hypothetical protein Cgig2_008264 [Carnegiea gigantea]
MSSGSGASTEDNVSLVEKSGEDVRVCGSDGDDTADVDADSGNGSGKGKSRKRRRHPIVEGRRRKTADDGFVFNKDRRGVRGVVPVSVKGRYTLEKIYKFNKTFKPYQREAIKGTILKPILKYRPFSMELTTALVQAWVPQKKTFRLVGRLVLFSMYVVAFLTGLPVIGKRVEFGDDDLSTTEFTRMYATEKSDKLKREKGSKKPVFRNYIKVMKKLLDTNKEPEKLGLWLSLYAWMVISGVMFPRTPYGAACSVQNYMEDIRRMGEYAWAKAMWRVPVEAVKEMQRKLEGPISDWYHKCDQYIANFRFGFICLFVVVVSVVLRAHCTVVKHDKGRFLQLASWDSNPCLTPPREEEMMVPTVRDLIKTDRFGYYLLDGEERLERAREELHAEKGKHIDTEKRLKFWMTHVKELDARLNICEAHREHQDARHQPGGDVWVGVHSESGMETLARAGNDVRELKGGEEDATFPTIGHILGDSCEGQNMATMTVDAVTSPENCVNVGLTPQYNESDVEPSPTVEDAGKTPSDATVMSFREGKVGTHEPHGEQQHPDPVLRESGALPETAEGEEVAKAEDGVFCVDEVDVAGHKAPREGVTMAPKSSAGNVEVGTPAGTEGLGNEVMIEPSMQFVNHGLSIAVESTAVDGAAANEACVEPPLGPSVENGTYLEDDAHITPESERTMSPDADDVPREADNVGKSSNIVTHMKRRPRCRKPAAAHDTPYTDPTHLPGVRNRQKDMTKWMTGADTAGAGSDPVREG